MEPRGRSAGLLVDHEGLKRLAHAKTVHEALPNLHWIPAGGADARLVVDAQRDQAWLVDRHGLVDEPLEILLVRSPGAVGEARARGDCDEIGNARGRRRLRTGAQPTPAAHR